MPQLQDQLQLYQEVLEKNPPHNPSTQQALLSKFVDGFYQDHSSSGFAGLIRDFWIAQPSIMAYTEISRLEATIRQRDAMLVNAAAWHWLTQHCVNQIQFYVSALVQDPY